MRRTFLVGLPKLGHLKSLWLYWNRESIAAMGVVSRAIDKVPTWAKVVLGVVAIVGSVYYVAQYGFWTFILHAIFSPEF